ncbi:MAG: hypothetical protein QM759_11535 [Terricaulis sp.]
MVDWNAISAGAGAASALFAGYSIWDATRQRAAQARRELACDIREEVKTAEDLIADLRNGRTLLVIADRLSAQTIATYQPQTKPELLAAAADLNRRVSRVLDWVEREPIYREFRQSQKQLTSASIALSARIPIVAPLTNMLLAIARDAVSAEFFFRFFSADMLALFAADVPDNATPPVLERALSNYLSSNSAGYFQARYVEALRLISAILHAFSTMPEKTLQRLSGAGNNSETYTGDMRNNVLRSRSVIGGAKAKELLTLIDQLEAAVSKKNASAELERARS